MRFSAASSSRPNSVRSRPHGRVVRPTRRALGWRADRASELERAPGLVALPERHLARLARRRRDHHAVERDVLDPPRRRAEHEHLAAPALVHHLLVELAHAAPVDGEHAEQPAVRDRAARGDRQPAGALARAQRVGPPVPHDPRPELGELVRGVPPGEQVQDVAQEVVRQLVEVRRPPEHATRDPRRSTRPSRTSRRSAARARRAGSAGSASPRSRPAASAARRPSPRAGRLGTSGTPCRGSARRPGGRRGRSAASRARPNPATPPGSRGPPRPCRCRARASSSRRSPSGSRASADPRSRAAARARSSRGAP